MKGPSQFQYKRFELDRWYYWIDGKQGHANGNVFARTPAGARSAIRARHSGCTIDHVIHEKGYHREETP